MALAKLYFVRSEVLRSDLYTIYNSAAREYKEDNSGRSLNRVQGGVGQSGEQGKGWPHKVCGKLHGRGECQYKCKECGKPHKEDDCFVLHPEKRPKSWGTPPGK